MITASVIAFTALVCRMSFGVQLLKVKPSIVVCEVTFDLPSVNFLDCKISDSNLNGIVRVFSRHSAFSKTIVFAHMSAQNILYFNHPQKETTNYA